MLPTLCIPRFKILVDVHFSNHSATYFRPNDIDWWRVDGRQLRVLDVEVTSSSAVFYQWLQEWFVFQQITKILWGGRVPPLQEMTATCAEELGLIPEKIFPWAADSLQVEANHVCVIDLKCSKCSQIIFSEYLGTRHRVIVIVTVTQNYHN